jgi:hypothetical protein
MSVRESLESLGSADIPVHTTLLQSGDPTLHGSPSNASEDAFIEDLEMEDPLSGVYVRDEFEPFSRGEFGFISASCVGVVLVPLLYLISQLKVVL